MDSYSKQWTAITEDQRRSRLTIVMFAVCARAENTAWLPAEG